MPNSEHDHLVPETGPVYSDRDVRQGDIVLRKPWERGVFVLGLASMGLFLAFVSACERI